MENRIIKFVSALRSLGVRVSLAESQDAFRAIENLGIQNRELFRISLRSTLIKNQSELKSFDDLFPLFFSASASPPLINLSDDLSPAEAQMIAQALQEFNRYLHDMLERLINGEPLTKEELERLSRMVGLPNANDLRFKEWMSRRMEQALRFKEIRQALEQLMQSMGEMNLDPHRMRQMRNKLIENQEGLRDQIRRYVGQKIAENMSKQTQEDEMDTLLNRPFNALSEKDMQALREEVRRIAVILRSRAALRQKRAKTGHLDPKATIRANLKHGGVPIQIKYRNRHLKPKLVVLCDISTSMRYCSELMLSLLYEMAGLVSKTHAFAFIDHLEYISPDFIGNNADKAVSQVLQRMPPGYYSTDLGYALTNFAGSHLDYIDSKTTFILVGDGRNNYNNPHVDIFRTISRRSNRTIWINPESQPEWGTGDSDMLHYAKYCDDILKASTLNELTAAVDKLLV